MYLLTEPSSSAGPKHLATTAPPAGTTPPAPSPPPVSAKPPLSLFPTEVQKKIESLDISSRQFIERVQEIQQDLARLCDEGIVLPEQLKIINDALNSLYKPDYFLPSVFEASLVDKIGCQHRSILDEFPRCQQRVQQEARLQVLLALKQGKENPKTLASSLDRMMKILENNLPKKRFSYLPEELQASPPLNKHFIQRLPQLLAAMKSMDEEIVTTYSFLWKRELRGLESTHSGFSSYLEKNFYKYSKKALCEHVSRGMYDLFNLDLVNNVEDFDKYLSAGLAAGKQRAASYFQENMRKNSPMHHWLSDNFSTIKKSYDQAVAFHTNLGFGTCFANCVDRHKALLDDPQLASKDLQMGSSSEGRFAQIVMVHNVNYLKDSGGSKEERQKLIHKSAKRLLTPSKSIDAFRIATLRSKIAEGYKQSQNLAFILCISDKSGNSHAINVQLYGRGESKIFRFIDDNAGVFEFENLEGFQIEFRKYLDIAYPGYDNCEIYSYKKRVQ